MNKKSMLAAAAVLLLGTRAIFAGAGVKQEPPAEKTHAGCPFEMPGVKIEKKALKDGYELAVTAERPEKAAELRARAAAHGAGCPLLGGDKATVENTAGGVKFIVTAKKEADTGPGRTDKKAGCSCCAGHGDRGVAGNKAQSKAAYVCPMGDFEGSDKPGRCPECGMNLVANKAK